MSREKSLVKNSAIISIGTFLPKLVSIVTLPIVTAGLTKREYGTYDLITTLVSCILPFTTLQIYAAAFRYLIEARNNKHEAEKYISSLLFYIVTISCISLVVVFFSLYKLSVELRIMICIYFFLDTLVLSLRQVVRGIRKNMVYSTSALVQSVTEMILVVVTIKHANKGLMGLLLSFNVALLASNLVLMLYGKVFTYIKIKQISFKTITKMIRYSWPLIPTVLADWVLSVSDRAVITTYIGIEAMAVYSAANKIPSLLNLIKTTFTYAWNENASIYSEDDDKKEYYSSIFNSIYNITVGATALLISGTPILFHLFIKGDYSDAYPQMPILFFGYFFSLLSAFYGGIYVANKKTISIGVTTFLAAIINLVVDLLLIKFIGIYAASISTVFGYLFLFIFRTVDLKRTSGISLNYVKIFSYILILVAMCVVCWQRVFILNCINIAIGMVFCIIINKDLIVKILKSVVTKLKKKA